VTHLFLQRLGADTAPTPTGSMREIGQWVADKHRVSLAELRGPRRSRYIVCPRHEAMALTMATGRYSYPQVGRFYDRDHTTVMYAVRAHEARLNGKRLVSARGPRTGAQA
jgi:chromosomal replication initiation ATPase DnaA